MKIWINGSLPSNLKPSELVITEGVQTPNVPEEVGGYLWSSFTSNTNIPIAKYTADYPSLYTGNASSTASMHIDKSFVNDSLLSNTTVYHYSSFVLLVMGAQPIIINGATNWTLVNMLPLNFTTEIKITGLSKLIQEQVQIDVMGEGS